MKRGPEIAEHNLQLLFSRSTSSIRFFDFLYVSDTRLAAEQLSNLFEVRILQPFPHKRAVPAANVRSKTKTPHRKFNREAEGRRRSRRRRAFGKRGEPSLLT